MRWLIAALAGLVLVLQYRIWLSPHGARDVLQLSRAVDRQVAENQRLADRNQSLVAEVRDLTQGYAALEERARSELGLIGAGETYFQVVPPALPVAPAPPVAPPVAPAAAPAALAATR
jgi:cell division protein FtsB